LLPLGRAKPGYSKDSFDEREPIQTNEIEYESSSERMVVRQQIHPDTARALREFAAKVINNDDVVH
jgi:hypothetical protein